MAFAFHDSMINEYWSAGYCIFRQIIPGSLLNDLRIEADKARALARELMGAQVPRIQPLVDYEDRLDLQPFRDYCELPELADAITKLMGPDYRHHNFKNMGILLNPGDHSWLQGWHRDGPVEVPHAAQSDPELQDCLSTYWHDRRVFNQINCALYNDSCLWYVPGSHARQRDLPGENQTHSMPDLPRRDDFTLETEYELACSRHCANFPGSRQMHLAAGDFMIYRNHGWHCAYYSSYQPRATIHDTCIYTGADETDFHQVMYEVKRAAVQRHRNAT